MHKRSLLLTLILFTINVHSQSFEPVSQNKILTLSDAIEQGLRQNNKEKIRNYKFELFDIYLQNNYEGFWFPQLSLTMSANDNYAQNLYSEDQDNYLSKSPNGSVGLGFEEYTLFNWGKDYLDYLNVKSTYEQSKDNVKADRRNLKLNIINQYFYLSSAKRMSLILKDQLRQTSFLYKLAKEKLQVRKINKQEFLQVKSEFLRSHEEYQASQVLVSTGTEELASLIGDDLITGYNIIDTLNFKKVNLKTDEAVSIALKSNQSIKIKTQELQNAQRSYNRSLKDALPLPKLSLKLGAFRHSFSSAGAKNEYYTNDDSSGATSKNIEVAASLNMSWKLYGSSGLFNSRDRKSYFLERKIAEIELNEAHRKTKTTIRSQQSSLRALERQVEALEAQLKNNKRSFDVTLDRYISGKTPFPNIKLTLDSYVNNQRRFVEAKFQHLEQKILLVKSLGKEDFPGENFEDLVLK